MGMDSFPCVWVEKRGDLSHIYPHDLGNIGQMRPQGGRSHMPIPWTLETATSG
jgi:hypothetical protein